MEVEPVVRKLYPGGKAKVFNISYDDGVEQDVRFVQLLNRYGVKGTFNLNSGLMKRGFEWTHECGMTVKRLPESVVVNLYEGHEVACHTYSHPYMDHYSETEILSEMGADRFFLERLFGKPVTGYATPFYYFSDLMEKCVQNCGFEYARISETDMSYSPWRDYYRWKGGLFHDRASLESYVDGFLQTDVELALCQLVGHSYDLDVYDMWNRMEAILYKIGSAEDVWCATHIELVRYLKQMEKAQIHSDYIYNNSDADLWFEVDGTTIVLHPGDKEEIK